MHLYNAQKQNVHAGLKAEALWKQRAPTGTEVMMVHANFVYCYEEKLAVLKNCCWVLDDSVPAACASDSFSARAHANSSWVEGALHTAIKNFWLPSCEELRKSRDKTGSRGRGLRR